MPDYPDAAYVTLALRIMYVARARPPLSRRPVPGQGPQKSTHAIERLVFEVPVAPLSRHAHRYVRMSHFPEHLRVDQLSAGIDTRPIV